MTARIFVQTIPSSAVIIQALYLSRYLISRFQIAKADCFGGWEESLMSSLRQRLPFAGLPVCGHESWMNAKSTAFQNVFL